MEMLPPGGWAEVAMKSDLCSLEVATKGALGSLEVRLGSRIDAVDFRLGAVANVGRDALARSPADDVPTPLRYPAAGTSPC